MEQLADLKAILHSKRANIYYLEKCRVMQKDGRVLYLTETKHASNTENQYWNIPIANTTCLLLGTGTSITQAAMRMLAQAGVRRWRNAFINGDRSYRIPTSVDEFLV
jgi:CRISPR-associated protein Cas1